MLKVAIVGCGKIADAHASVIQRVKECEIVGVCDREPLMAQQLSERFGVKAYFTDLTELLRQARPEVVHVTTPPESHFDIARTCLEWGSHVYIEKPFTLNAGQAQQLIELAVKKGLKLTVGHNEQFTQVAGRMRSLVHSGYLGGPAVHIESCYVYDLGDPSYARALLGDKQHWVRKLPGGLLQNVMSHGVARIAEFLSGDAPQVMVHSFVSSVFRSINENEMVDELRVILWDEEGTTAYFTFSTQMQPAIHQFRIYGAKNGLELDQDHDTLIMLRGPRFKSYAEKFLPPLLFAKQYLKNLAINVKLFLARDFHFDAGMKSLIDAFYVSIREDGPVPIPYREILLTAKIMDAIIEQLNGSRLQSPSALQEQTVTSVVKA